MEVGRHQYGSVVGLPQTQKQYDSIWVVMNNLAKSSQCIPIKSTYSAEDYEKIFKDDVVCPNSILLSIISDKGSQFSHPDSPPKHNLCGCPF